KSIHRSGAGDDGRTDLISPPEPFDALRATLGAGCQDGTSVLAGPPAILVQRLQYVPAEAADGRLRLDAQQPGGLDVQISDVAALIHRVDALDDAPEHRLRLGLPAPQRAGQLQQVATHVLHGSGEGADLRGTAGRNRYGEV